MSNTLSSGENVTNKFYRPGTWNHLQVSGDFSDDSSAASGGAYLCTYDCMPALFIVLFSSGFRFIYLIDFEANNNTGMATICVRILPPLPPVYPLLLRLLHCCPIIIEIKECGVEFAEDAAPGASEVS